MTDGAVTLSAGQLRALLDHLAAAAALLGAAQPALASGDREVAETLLPAWHATLAGANLTAGELLRADPASALGAWASVFSERYSTPTAAAQSLGCLLKRLQGHAIAGLRVERLGHSGSNIWQVSPA